MIILCTSVLRSLTLFPFFGMLCFRFVCVLFPYAEATANNFFLICVNSDWSSFRFSLSVVVS